VPAVFLADYDKVQGQPKGSCVVRAARVLLLSPSDYGREFAFGVTPPLSSRTYVLVAFSAVERDDWVKALTKHGAVLYSSGDLTSVPGGAGLAASHDRQSKVDPRSLFEGHLFKQSSQLKTWNRRYFALFAHTLVYYKHKGDVQPAGDIPLLAGGTVAVEDTPKNDKDVERGFAFSLTPLGGTSQRKVLLVADSEADRQAWLGALEPVCMSPAVPGGDNHRAGDASGSDEPHAAVGNQGHGAANRC